MKNSYYENSHTEQYIIYNGSSRIPPLKQLIIASLPKLRNNLKSEYGIQVNRNWIPNFRIQFWECRSSYGPEIHWWIDIRACECAFSTIDISDSDSQTYFNGQLDPYDTPHRYCKTVRRLWLI